MLLEGKVAVIHGGGGSIGGAVAKTFAREGARVYLAGRTAPRLEAVADAIAAAGGEAEWAVVDALDEAAVIAHADEVAEAAGRIDVAFNAIGVPDAQGKMIGELTTDEFEFPIVQYTRTNFAVAKAAAKHMQAQGSGVILTVTPPGAKIAAGGILGHAAACGAVEAFSRTLSGELGPSGIRVVCMRSHGIPEAVATSHTSEIFGDFAERSGVTVDQLLEGFSAGTMLKRLPRLSDIADFAAFAASDRASVMTGEIANLTAGMTFD